MTDHDAKVLTELKAKLAARKGQPGFAENVRAIEARIAEMEGANVNRR